MMLKIFAIFLFVALCNSQDSNICKQLPDGEIPEYGCVGYTICRGGEAIYEECAPNVFNPEIMACDDPLDTPAPCGFFRDCTNLDSGHYADLERDCTGYFTCLNGTFRGYNPCVGGLVYDDYDKCVCNWPWAVPPPCGTLVIPYQANSAEEEPNQRQGEDMFSNELDDDDDDEQETNCKI